MTYWRSRSWNHTIILAVLAGFVAIKVCAVRKNEWKYTFDSHVDKTNTLRISISAYENENDAVEALLLTFENLSDKQIFVVFEDYAFSLTGDVDYCSRDWSGEKGQTYADFFAKKYEFFEERKKRIRSDQTRGLKLSAGQRKTLVIPFYDYLFLKKKHLMPDAMKEKVTAGIYLGQNRILIADKSFTEFTCFLAKNARKMKDREMYFPTTLFLKGSGRGYKRRVKFGTVPFDEKATEKLLQSVRMKGVKEHGEYIVFPLMKRDFLR